MSTDQVLQLRSDYLADLLMFTDKELSLAHLVAQRLPEVIIDAHSHNATKADIRCIDDRAIGHMLSTLPYFTVSESDSLNAKLYPGVAVRSLRFGMVYRGVDYAQMNAELHDTALPDDRVALFGVQDDIEYTLRELTSRKYVALKMYYLYRQPTATKIIEVFPREVLESVEELGIPIILHLPQSRAIQYHIEEILEIKQIYPRLKATICHLGSTEEYDKEVNEAYELFTRETDFMLDTALSLNKKTLQVAIDIVGPKRIMYGSDAPLNLLRSRHYLHPVKGKRIVTERQYHWTDISEWQEYVHLAKGAIHNHWQSISDLLDVIETNFSTTEKSVKHHIFYANAEQFYSFGATNKEE